MGISTDSSGRILVKLRDPAARGIAAAGVELRPLFDEPPGGLGVDAGPSWFVAELTDGASTWDSAHDQLAARLGVDQDQVLFAEPDLYNGSAWPEADQPGDLGLDSACGSVEPDNGHGKAVGPDEFDWHLGQGYSTLGEAREAVTFAEPRTRIAHLDTGYYPPQASTPKHLRADLARNFADGRERGGAVDPDTHSFFPDNSGHGTGTIGILAGNQIAAKGDRYLGGAPEADVVPVRVADRVVLLRTSALAQGIEYATRMDCDVISLSMGGVPSRAWEDAINAAYDKGVVLCAAAGNRFGVSPPWSVVYPAQYDPVIAVCGVMANQHPYADLDGLVLEGCFGPQSAMDYAIAAYTPNIAWPRFGCAEAIRYDGQGTSAATPQVAAAAALWLEKYKHLLPRDWRRVEAVRNALFATAAHEDPTHFGRGVLRAAAALTKPPDLNVTPCPPARSSFPALRLIFGLGLDGPTTREEMFSLELAQWWLTSPAVPEPLRGFDRTRDLDTEQLKMVMAAIIDDERVSKAFRSHIEARYPVVGGRPPGSGPASIRTVGRRDRACDPAPALASPAYRTLRVYALDPSFATSLDRAAVNEVTLELPWEPLKPGRPQPDTKAQDLGDYFAVADIDPSGQHYPAVDLDDIELVAQDGWAPSEGNPHFHQQMVYAVATKTVQHFERALGRRVLWRPKVNAAGDRTYRPRLLLRPHALRQANAFYSPDEVALLFGYFDADRSDPGDHWPGSRVYTCLSHDIIAHETTHAVLDGMHRLYNQATNPDVLAFHEAFADIVALLQHFTLPALLEHEISRSRGRLDTETVLGSLAVQFGRASGRHGALREAIGFSEGDTWQRNRPDPAQYRSTGAPHPRGGVLVAAVFDAFLAIYHTRTADLVRLATGGSGVLGDGAIHPDLVHRLAMEASKTARHVLTMAIRAVDYLPPVDVTFFDYLRALITADVDLVADDHYGYRIAFVEAFRRRGIYPEDIDSEWDLPRTLSVDTVRWRGRLGREEFSKVTWERIEKQYAEICAGLKAYADQCVYLRNREKLFQRTDEFRCQLQTQLRTAFAEVPAFARQLGLDPRQDVVVEELRRAARVSPDGRVLPQIVVSLTQSTDLRSAGRVVQLQGGSTVIVDLQSLTVAYSIRKNITSKERLNRARAKLDADHSDPLRAFLTGSPAGEAFGLLHTLDQA